MAVRLRIILSVFLVTAAVVVGSMLATFWFGNRVLDGWMDGWMDGMEDGNGWMDDE